jgi:peroxiredoxin
MIQERSKRRMMLGLLAVLAALSLLFSGCGDGSAPAGTPTPASTPATSVAPVLDAFAPGFTLATLEGQTVKLEELRGQPVFLTFWTTKCGACRSQVPFVQAAFEEKGEEVSFVAVNIMDSSDTVQQYAESEGVSFTIALDSDAAVAVAYNVRYIPYNFLIDPEGVIRDLRIGAFSSTEELLAALDDL